MVKLFSLFKFHCRVIKVVRLLLEHGADVNVADSR